MDETKTIHLEINEKDIQLLSTCRTEVIVRDQPCRFEACGPGDQLSRSWEGGQMTWCENAAEALIIRAYERANGFKAMILWDIEIAEAPNSPADAWVVLSSRPFIRP